MGDKNKKERNACKGQQSQVMGDLKQIKETNF